MSGSLCVFCSARVPHERYLDLARALAGRAVDASWRVVYGGTSVGLMGVLADAVLARGGEVYGVVPRVMVRGEASHGRLTRLFVMDDLHKRKEKMYGLADVFVAIPGGYGTLDELCEILTWAKLGLHDKPVFLLNHDGFYDRLLGHFRFLEAEGFIGPSDLALLRTVPDIDALFDGLARPS